jgi:hypothetical protein
MPRPALPKFVPTLRALAVSAVCLLAVSLVQFVYAAPDAPAAPGSIAGVVRTGAAPLAGINVDLYWPNGQIARTTTTDANGAWQIALLPAGAYRVGFSDPAGIYARQYYSGAVALEMATDVLVLGQDVAGIDATLTPGGAISGTVALADPPIADPAVGTANAVLYVQSDAEWVSVASATISGTTTYQFTQLLPGVYRVCVQYYGSLPDYVYFISCHDRVSVGVEDATDVVVQAGQTTPDIDVHFGGETDIATLAGTITGTDGGSLSGVTVYAQASHAWTTIQTRTDDTGSYTFGWLPPDTYRVRFSDLDGFGVGEHYANATSAIDATPITLAPGEARIGVDAELSLGGRITGEITLPEEMQPSFLNLQVYAADNPYQATATRSIQPDEVYYSLGGLPPGRYKVSMNGAVASPYPGPDIAFWAPVYYGGSDFASAAVITVTAGGTVGNIDMTYNSGAFDGVLQGNVTGAGTPVSGARVELYLNYYYDPLNPVSPSLVAYAMTDAAGAYRIEGVPTQVYNVIYRDPALNFASSQRQRVYIQSGTPILISVDLAPGSTISGQLRRRDGSPAAGGYVMAQNYAELGMYQTFDTASAADGSYQLRGLPAGQYQVCANIDTFFICYGEMLAIDMPPGAMPVFYLVALSVGEERSGVDISLEPPRRAYLPTVQRE